MSRVSIRPRGSKTPRGGRTPRSPSENMVAEARETERMAAAGAWKAETDSRRARATTAVDCMIILRTEWRGGERTQTGASRRSWHGVPTPCAVCGAGAARAANSGGSGREHA